MKQQRAGWGESQMTGDSSLTFPYPHFCSHWSGEVKLTLTIYHALRPECKMETITTSQDVRNVQERIKSIEDVISMGERILIKLKSQKKTTCLERLIETYISDESTWTLQGLIQAPLLFTLMIRGINSLWELTIYQIKPHSLKKSISESMDNSCFK